MTSTIKVNNIQNQCGANIINENSNTITIGASGDTVSLASGASQTGFGRTGAVNWDTTVKTGDFTATDGSGFFVNAAGGAVTVTLPGSPSAGAIVGVSDYNSSSETNAITIGRNGSNINGSAADLKLNKIDSAVQLVYVDATTGWQNITTANPTDLSNPFMIATGGTVTEDGNFKIHTFTGPGTFAVSQAATSSDNNVVSYVIVAGGGGGGRGNGGGGGAGGYREVKSPTAGTYTASPLDGYPNAPNRITVTATNFPITVGGGGNGRTGGSGRGCTGSNSTFSTITSAGGGGGGSNDSPGNGFDGGSGGGGGNPNFSGGSGNSPSTTPAQGNNGGNAVNSSPAAAGGGGAGAAGNPTGGASTGGPGGAGVTSSINATPTARAGGGGGGVDTSGGTKGTGGSGGGGDGTIGPGGSGCAGTANTGGGGGGGGGGSGCGGNGGSGVVIIRYKFQ